jgi:hypothetical protein
VTPPAIARTTESVALGRQLLRRPNQSSTDFQHRKPTTRRASHVKTRATAASKTKLRESALRCRNLCQVCTVRFNPAPQGELCRTSSMAGGWESESARLQTIDPDALTGRSAYDSGWPIHRRENTITAGMKQPRLSEGKVPGPLRASREGTLAPQRSLTDHCIVVAVSPNRNHRVGASHRRKRQP